MYADDFLAGTADMTAEEVGIYARLLCHSWNKKGLKNDERRLGMLVGTCTGNAVASAVEVLKLKFELGPDNIWRNARLEQTRQNQEEYSRSQSDKAHLRWEKVKSAAAKPEHAGASASALPAQCSPSPSPTPYQVSDKASQALEKPIQKAGKVNAPLSAEQREIATRFETVLNGQWVNDAGKWILRIRGVPAKCQRVVAELESALKEQRIKTTPAQYAEQIWKEFQ